MGQTLSKTAGAEALAIWQEALGYGGGMNFSKPPSTLPPSAQIGSGSASGRAAFGQAAASAMSMKWSALHDAAGIVASLAGMSPDPMRADQRNFPAVVRDAGGWRRTMAEQGVDDLSVIMEAGIAALLAVRARGVDARAAALSLWQEYLSARTTLLALAPTSEAMRRAF